MVKSKKYQETFCKNKYTNKCKSSIKVYHDGSMRIIETPHAPSCIIKAKRKHEKANVDLKEKKHKNNNIIDITNHNRSNSQKEYDSFFCKNKYRSKCLSYTKIYHDGSMRITETPHNARCMMKEKRLHEKELMDKRLQ
jgi:hypothetical protein